MFFSRFENIDYQGRSIKDLSTALALKPEIKDNKDLFFWYELEEWETPDSAAFDHYGNSKYNFVLLMMNNIIDPFFDWPLSYKELIRLCEERYGVPTITGGKYDTNGYYAVRFWEKDGIRYPAAPGSGLDGEAPPQSLAVSHLEYEERLNNEKRRIKILYPELIPQLDRELDIIFNG